MFRLVLRPIIYLVSEVLLTNQKYKDAVQAGIFFDRLLENIRRLPGVVAASMTNNEPFSYQEEGNYTPFAIVGRPLPEQGQAPAMDVETISSRYFQTMQTPILEGRDFNESDQRTGPSVVIINQAFADALFPGQDPLGKQITMVFPWQAGQAVQHCWGGAKHQARWT